MLNASNKYSTEQDSLWYSNSFLLKITSSSEAGYILYEPGKSVIITSSLLNL